MHIEDDHKMLFNILKMLLLLLLMIVLSLDGKDDHKLCCTTTTNFSENSRCKSNIQPTLVPCHETDWVTVRHFWGGAVDKSWIIGGGNLWSVSAWFHQDSVIECLPAFVRIWSCFLLPSFSSATSSRCKSKDMSLILSSTTTTTNGLVTITTRPKGEGDADFFFHFRLDPRVLCLVRPQFCQYHLSLSFSFDVFLSGPGKLWTSPLPPTGQLHPRLGSCCLLMQVHCTWYSLASFPNGEKHLFGHYLGMAMGGMVSSPVRWDFHILQCPQDFNILFI